MKEFLKKIVLFFFPIIFIFCGAEYILRHIPNDYSSKNNYLKQNGNEIEILILGSSHAYRGINPSYFDCTTFNAAYVSQTIDYDYFIFKKFEKELTSLETIVLTISPFTLYNQLQDGTESWRVKNYSIYYQVPKKIESHLDFELTSMRSKVNFKRFYSYYLLKRTPNLSQENGFKTFSLPQLSQNEFVKSAREASERHNYKTLKRKKQNQNYINNIVQYGKKNGIDIVFVFPPVSEDYYSLIQENQKTETRSFIGGLVKSNDHLYSVDLTTNEMFQRDHFQNADHLNKKGAEKLSSYLNEKICVN